MKCKKCGMEVDGNTYKRCPRCNTILHIPLKCSECKGCRLYKANSKSAVDCPSKG